ncbi:MAG: hypothetical protein Q4Q53_01510 [Methanocorpusculum sp.]|nr:hypothetical protein [Methanocorpusculum sp.]
MKTKSFGLIAILLVAVVVGFIGIGSMVSAGGPEEITQKAYVSGDVKAFVQLLGNDIAVSIVEENNTRTISSIYVYYESSPLPRSDINTCNDVKVGEPITFKNMAEGKKGADNIVVEAVFEDKSTEIIGKTYFSFL